MPYVDLYINEVAYAMRFTGGEDYLDQIEIWEVMARVFSGSNEGTATLQLPR